MPPISLSSAIASAVCYLLPKSFNASYGDLPYEDKLPHYLTQNLLARSLHPQCYEHNPGFLKFKEQSGLSLAPFDSFQENRAGKSMPALYRARQAHLEP